MNELEVNGQWPEIEKQTLQEMIVQEFWYDGVLEEPANVIYLKFSNSWYRLYFDCGIVFWREDNEGLEDELASRNNDIGYPLIDLAEKQSIKGAKIIQCKGSVVPEGSEVEFQFSTKKSVIFQCINDITSILTKR